MCVCALYAYDSLYGQDFALYKYFFKLLSLYSLNLFVLPVHHAESLPGHCEYSLNLFHRYTAWKGCLDAVHVPGTFLFHRYTG